MASDPGIEQREFDVVGIEWSRHQVQETIPNRKNNKRKGKETAIEDCQKKERSEYTDNHNRGLETKTLTFTHARTKPCIDKSRREGEMGSKETCVGRAQ
jgi:hypothetical protein